MLWTSVYSFFSGEPSDFSDLQLVKRKGGRCKCCQLARGSCKRKAAVKKMEYSVSLLEISDPSTQVKPETETDDSVCSSDIELIEFRGYDRKEIHSLHFLRSRPIEPDVGTLLVALRSGRVQVWSHHPQGGLIDSFFATHVMGDYVTCMASDSDGQYLFTGHLKGYIKIWHIIYFGLPRRHVNQERDMGALNVVFSTFLCKELSMSKARKASQIQEEPLLLFSCQCHLSKVSHIELLLDRNIYITCGLDKTVRLWLLGGKYIGVLGGITKWPEPNEEGLLEPESYKVPSDLKRVLSAASFKVMTNQFSDQAQETEAALQEMRRRKSVEARELTEPLHTTPYEKPMLGKKYELPGYHVEPLPEPKLDVESPVLRILNHLETMLVTPITRPLTPEALKTECKALIRPDIKPKPTTPPCRPEILSDSSTTGSEISLDFTPVSSRSVSPPPSIPAGPEEPIAEPPVVKKATHHTTQRRKLDQFLDFVQQSMGKRRRTIRYSIYSRRSTMRNSIILSKQ